jgi:hypothetical protein
MLARMAYPNDDLEPAGILDQILFLPPFMKQEHYGRLTRFLEGHGYQIDPANPDRERPTAYTFSYDWRQDNRISARQLGKAIEKWQQNHPGAKVWLIGHSNGGIVSRWYVEKEGGNQHVSRLFLMGSPWDGAPKALEVLLNGMDVFLLKALKAGPKIQKLIRTFPSFYHLIPHTAPFLRDDRNQVVDLYADPSWLATPQERAYLADAGQFNRDLGHSMSVAEAICFYGTKKPTTTAGVVSRDAGGGIHSLQWIKSERGDGTVPERSAVHPKISHPYAFQVDHGSVYINPVTVPQLERELINRYLARPGVSFDTAVDEFKRSEFEPVGDQFTPGETIPLWATVNWIEDNLPISKASVEVTLQLVESIGESAAEATPAASLRLAEVPGQPGRYEGSLTAPPQQGYYNLSAVIETGDERPMVLEELILVEA